jgi:hypothetical protein
MYTSQQFLEDLKQPYAWPGGYPRYFVTSDGAALSFKAADEESGAITDSIDRRLNDGWQVIGCDRENSASIWAITRCGLRSWLVS